MNLTREILKEALDHVSSAQVEIRYLYFSYRLVIKTDAKIDAALAC